MTYFTKVELAAQRQALAMLADEDNYAPFIESGEILLPHQCDKWWIGGRKETEIFIAKLQELLKDQSLKP